VVVDHSPTEDEDHSPPPLLLTTDDNTLTVAVSPTEETPTVDGMEASKPPWQLIGGVACTPPGAWNKTPGSSEESLTEDGGADVAFWTSPARNKTPDVDSSSSEGTFNSPLSLSDYDSTRSSMWWANYVKEEVETKKRKAEELAEELEKMRATKGYKPAFIFFGFEGVRLAQELASDAAAAGAAMEQREESDSSS
jgi:hypothetical protein